MRRACTSPSTRAANSPGERAIASIIRAGIAWLWTSTLMPWRMQADACSASAADEVDLDATTGHEQPAHLQRRARRRGREEFLPYLVEVMEIGEVGQEYLRLHDVVQRAAGGLEHAPQIAENVPRLLLDVRAVVRKRRVLPCLVGHAGGLVRCQLPRRVEHVADEHAVATVRHRRRYVLRRNDLARYARV